MCWLCAGCCSVDVLAVIDVVPVWLCYSCILKSPPCTAVENGCLVEH